MPGRDMFGLVLRTWRTRVRQWRGAVPVCRAAPGTWCKTRDWTEACLAPAVTTGRRPMSGVCPGPRRLPARDPHCRMRTSCALRSPSMPPCMAVKPGFSREGLPPA